MCGPMWSVAPTQQPTSKSPTPKPSTRAPSTFQPSIKAPTFVPTIKPTLGSTTVMPSTVTPSSCPASCPAMVTAAGTSYCCGVGPDLGCGTCAKSSCAANQLTKCSDYVSDNDACEDDDELPSSCTATLAVTSCTYTNPGRCWGYVGGASCPLNGFMYICDGDNGGTL